MTALQLPGLKQLAGWRVRGRSEPAARALADRYYSHARTLAERRGGLFDHRGGGR